MRVVIDFGDEERAESAVAAVPWLEEWANGSGMAWTDDVKRAYETKMGGVHVEVYTEDYPADTDEDEFQPAELIECAHDPD